MQANEKRAQIKFVEYRRADPSITFRLTLTFIFKII